MNALKSDARTQRVNKQDNQSEIFVEINYRNPDRNLHYDPWPETHLMPIRLFFFEYAR